MCTVESDHKCLALRLHLALKCVAKCMWSNRQHLVRAEVIAKVREVAVNRWLQKRVSVH